LNQTFSKLQEKLSDKNWTDTQEPDFIEALQNIESIFQQLSAQTYLFIDYFTQYVNIIQSSFLFQGDDNQSDGNTYLSPTQTSAPANREERRAKAKADKVDKKLLVPEKKLIVP
jgi:hypothetical protein